MGLAHVAAEALEQTRIANAQVAALVERAEKQLAAGDVEPATEALREALAVENASERATKPVEEIRDAIAFSNDAQRVEDILVDLDDEEFRVFRDSGRVPGALVVGYPVLDERVLALAKETLDRAQARRAQIAAELAAAEEERQRREAEEERRRAEELAEREREEREEKARAEEERARAQKKLNEARDLYAAALELTASSLVDSVRVRRQDGGCVGDGHGAQPVARPSVSDPTTGRPDPVGDVGEDRSGGGQRRRTRLRRRPEGQRGRGVSRVLRLRGLGPGEVTNAVEPRLARTRPGAARRSSPRRQSPRELRGCRRDRTVPRAACSDTAARAAPTAARAR